MRFGMVPFLPLINSASWFGSIEIKGKWIPADHLVNHLSITNSILHDYYFQGKRISYLQRLGCFPTAKYNSLSEYLRTEAAENTRFYFSQIFKMTYDKYDWLEMNILNREIKDKVRKFTNYGVVLKVLISIL